MCRVLAYLGQPILLDDLLYQPDSSLIKQIYDPQDSVHMMHLAGFGLAAWLDTSIQSSMPIIYKTKDLAFYDKNLKNLAQKIEANCLIAHIRGVPFSIDEVISQENLHPFMFPNYKIALAHNGDLSGIDLIRKALINEIKTEIVGQINGNTDTEIIYALLMSQFEDPAADHSVDEVVPAVRNTLQIIKDIRQKHHQHTSSAVNLFISNGEYIIATRYLFNYGSITEGEVAPSTYYHTLYYTYGEQYGLYDGEYKMKGKKKRSFMLASEPLTKDATTWISVPEYSLVTARCQEDKIKVEILDLEI